MRRQRGVLGSFTAGVLTLALFCDTVAIPAISGHASGVTQPHPTFSSVPNTQHNPDRPHAADTYRKAPLSFEANVGQADKSVKFVARGVGYQLHLTPTQAVLSLNKEAGGKHKQNEKNFRSRQNSRRSSVSDVVRMTLLNARSDATVSGEDVLPGKANYLLGNDPQSWRTNVATYGKVRYKNVYQGIDLVYYGNQRSLEYDFHLGPAANPEEIRLGIEGVKRTEIDSVTGDLIMRLSSGEVIRQHKPVLYQEVDDVRRAVSGRFVFRGRNQIGFEVGAYDKSRALVIDPVLVYTTYFGGAGDEATTGIAVDSAGSVYVSGALISSPGFPVTPNAFQKTQNNSNGNGEVFITKFTPDGADMVYSTLLGGSSTDTSTGIALDTTGNAYVVGWTDSADFPVRNAFQSTLRGFPNAFVTKLNATGSDLLYSTFLGGSGNFDFGTDIAVDPSGNAYITGDTTSINFPVTPGALRTTHIRLLNPVGDKDGFVAKFNTNATGEASLVFSTFLDINDPFSNAIDIDSAGNAYITGDARVQKLNAAGSALIYSFIIPDATTAINSRLHTTDIAVDGSGQAYVTGFETRFAGETSPNLKVVNGFQPTFGGGLIDGFLIKLNPAGTALLYSTYLGGGNIDVADAVAVDSTGHAYVVGDTASADFPLRDAFQTIKVGGNDLDLFIAKIDTNAIGANSLGFSTYYGASNSDEGASGVAIDTEGNIYATGYPFRISLSGIIHTGNIPADGSGQTDPFILKIANTSPSVIRFGSERLAVSESAGSFEVTVMREGDSSAAADVDFATLDGQAQHGSDYTSTNGTLHFEPGETTKTFPVLITDDAAPEPNETLFVILRENIEGVALAAPSVAALTILDDDATVQLSDTAFSVSEGAGFANLTVTRVGDISRTATVLYSTADTAGLQSCTVVNNKASERCDYSTTAGRVDFGIGQTTQSIIIPIVDDALVEGNETFTVTLNGPAGALLGAVSTASITITDNDSSPASQNPIDDVSFFVTQQYIDLLGRLPDPIGLANWIDTLGNCPNNGFGEFDNPTCDRVHVSSSFFLSDEFRARGYFAYKFYEVGFDRRPTYAEFVPDMAQVGGAQSPEAEVISKAAYTDAFVQRQEFKNRYDALSNSAYVDALEANSEVTLTNKAALVDALNTSQKTRAQVLREIVELQSVTDKFFIRAFVAMQYFGYMRRDPDTIGYNNWVTTLTADPNNLRHMIFGFIYSTEYRQRFGP
jgi:Calx-beta domain-containing protein/beta-propeller repeat-containing protein/uncharacterized protein DUF4214